jgi:hypothetical protein
MAMAQEIRTYTDLLQQIRNDLRIQHPEWIQPDGSFRIRTKPNRNRGSSRLKRLLGPHKRVHVVD